MALTTLDQNVSFGDRASSGSFRHNQPLPQHEADWQQCA